MRIKLSNWSNYVTLHWTRICKVSVIRHFDRDPLRHAIRHLIRYHLYGNTASSSDYRISHMHLLQRIKAPRLPPTPPSLANIIPYLIYLFQLLRPTWESKQFSYQLIIIFPLWSRSVRIEFVFDKSMTYGYIVWKTIWKIPILVSFAIIYKSQYTLNLCAHVCALVRVYEIYIEQRRRKKYLYELLDNFMIENIDVINTFKRERSRKS